MLDIYAGDNALKTIQEHGFKQELFTNFLGASGGPKWFALFGLDKYLFGEFFKGRATELNLIGSSAGSFRAACFAQKDPVAAITRMAKSYAETTYSDKAKPQEITEKAIELIDYFLSKNGVEEIVNNKVFKAHFLVNKTNGLVASESRLIQSVGLVKSILLNRFDRKLITKQYERMVFKPSDSKVVIDDYCDFNTHYVDLTQENLKSSLLASGSIPMVMQGIKDIAGAPQGMYRDGGIIDYHFDINILSNDGLTLYPHFNSRPKAGWFDKNLNRDVKAEHYNKTVMLVPSDKFIDSLPYKKIPDRKDFTSMDASTRIKYWKKVLEETEKVAECFERYLSNPSLINIKAL